MNKFGESFWDERYSGNNLAYGTEPNNFFKDQIDLLNPGKILMPGDGEGRNGIYAAQKGWEVDAVDFSQMGKEKALKQAVIKKVKINYIIDNLENYCPKKNYYSAAGLIFIHLNKSIRTKVHQRIYEALKPGGILIMEVYSKEQLGKSSGGPQNPDMLYSEDDIKSSFKKLKIFLLKKQNIYLNESTLHSGEASVIRFVGKKET